MTTAQTWDEFQEAAEVVSAVRKTLGAVVFVGAEDAPVPGPITTDGIKVNPLPEGYEPLGLITPEGVDLPAEINFDDVEALGHFSPVRRDPSSGSRSISLNLYEVDRRKVNEIVDQVDLSTKVPTAESGEVEWEVQDVPQIIFHRIILISFDGSFDKPVFSRRFFPKVQLTSLPSEQFAKADPRSSQLTFTSYKDDELGYIVKKATAGLGFKEIAARLGWPTA